ncbi:TonB family protein [Sphingomonas sp. C3-2]|uniref:energy transducer TonB n=1 Tax=Sphingomonas sp. C3-2 TaxID=3062169 RepID=UPI00294AE239|nr:TonB family protein [Sphingomonas sp. C3-2]WOK36289.1 TonB family protein [Sphingomonas sp. C3-2]
MHSRLASASFTTLLHGAVLVAALAAWPANVKKLSNGTSLATFNVTSIPAAMPAMAMPAPAPSAAQPAVPRDPARTPTAPALLTAPTPQILLPSASGLAIGAPLPALPPTNASGSGMGPAVPPAANGAAAPHAAASPAGSASDAFESAVHRWIERHKAFPAQLASRGIHGTVIVAFELDRRGRLHHLRIERSSGHAALDTLATSQLAGAVPFPRAPHDAGWRLRAFSVPMTYRAIG